MHFAIKEKNENIWIAQREGRAKDIHDFGLRQPMLHMVAHRRELRLVVVSPVAFAFSHERRLPAKPV